MFKEDIVEVYGAETLYREMGCYQRRRKQYRQSLPAFNKAAELAPTDKRVLMGRSWANAKTTSYDCALSDIKQALKHHPDDLQVKQLNAHYKYLITDFEDALVLNYRGLYERKKPNWFEIGVKLNAEIVERTIGKRSGNALRDHYDIIRKIAWKNAIDLRKGPQWRPRFKKHKLKEKNSDVTPALYTNYMKKSKETKPSVYNSQMSILESLTDMKNDEYSVIPKKKTDYKPLQNRTKNIHNVMAEKYWNKLSYDKTFIKNLRSDPRLDSPNEEGYKKIIGLAKKCNTNISYRQEILRTRLPFYSIKAGEAIAKGALLQRQQEDLKKVQDVSRYDVETLLKLLRAARANNCTNAAIHIANSMKSYIDRKPLKILPNKEIYLRQLYDLVGLVYLDRYRLKHDMSDADAVRRIKFLIGLPISREPSRDSVIQSNKQEFINIKNAINRRKESMEKCTTPLETIWIFYDLAKFNLHLKKWDFCRFYSRRALNMALVLDNYVWATTALMLITKTYIMQKNKNEAKNSLKETKNVAKHLKHDDIMIYIDKCLEVIETLDDTEEIRPETVITERETAMINTLKGPTLQSELRHLFIQMDAIPANRRMSIMPGMRVEQSTSKSTKAGSKPSIKPVSKSAMNFAEMLSPKQGIEALDN